jgi:signal transduction histidine kinase
VLVVLSYLISVLGSYCCLQCAVQISRDGRRMRWLAAAAVAMGGGATWSMHFIAMTACRLPFAVTYDPLLTLASLALAVVVTGFGFYVVSSDRTDLVRFLAGGTFTGVGIAAMHYTGMAAMRMPARLLWRPPLILASVLIAIAAVMLALWLAFKLHTRWQRLGSAFVMAGAVCGMHYAGMAAAIFVPADRSLTAKQPVHGADELGFMIFGITLLVLALLLMESRVTEYRALAGRLREVREEESARIAREVHDVVGQMLTALRLDVAWLEKTLGSAGLPEREELAGKLRSMGGLLDTAADAVQRITTALRPAILDHFGLEAAVEWHAGELEKRTGISVRLRAGLGATVVAADRATALFRILQEALTNVVRHAGATQVDIHLAAEGNRLVLTIADNGSGIAEDRIADPRSLGLLGMRERARSVGGDVVVRRRPSRGTSVEATLPL